MSEETNTIQLLEKVYADLENICNDIKSQTNKNPDTNLTTSFVNVMCHFFEIQRCDDLTQSQRMKVEQNLTTLLHITQTLKKTATKKREENVCGNETPTCNALADSTKLEVEKLAEFLCAPIAQGFESICALDGVLKQIKTMFILPHQQPQLFPDTAYNYLLLYGPPGCGKTQLVHALSKELDAKLYCITPSNVMSKWLGDAERIIRKVFETLRARDETTILFIDEVDAFCRQRNDNEPEHSRRVKIEFMQQLSAESGGQRNRMLVIAATNVPWDIDSAVVRRFQRKLHLGLPDAVQRSALLEYYLGARTIPETDHALLWQQLINKTDGYSASDLKEVVRCARHKPIEELLDVQRWSVSKAGVYTQSLFPSSNDVHCSLAELPAGAVQSREVDLVDLLSATETVSPSVGKFEIAKFQAYNN